MKYALSCIAAALMVALLAGPVAAQGGAQISFSPESVEADIGATVAVDVTVASVDPDPGLASYDLTLTFDPAVVRLDSFSDTGFVTSGQNVVICVTGQIDNTRGSVNATCTAIPLFGAPGVSTTGPVALLHGSFTALDAGTSPLTLSGSLSSPTGTPIAATFASGSINVTAAAPVPSATTAAPATPSPASLPTRAGAASPTVLNPKTTSAGTTTRATSPAATETPRVPPTGNGGGRGGTIRNVTILAVVAAALGIAGSAVVWRRRQRTDRP